jgi:hypothetical protein
MFTGIKMEVITIESQAFRDLTTKINTIAKFVSAIKSKTDEEPPDGWVDSYEVCTFLKISARTLQRLRAAKSVNYSRIRGKTFYKISEIQRLMDNHIIHSSEENLQNLIKNHQFHVEQRRNIRTDK